jgi:hypothetical protein
LILTTNWNVLKILKVVAPHGSLRHLELNIGIIIPMNIQEEWKEVFSQICTRLSYFGGWTDIDRPDFEAFAPLVNAKYLTTLKLRYLPTSETFRQMADNYTCLQNVDFSNIDDWSENSDVTYFLDKQKETLTSLVIVIWAISLKLPTFNILKKLSSNTHQISLIMMSAKFLWLMDNRYTLKLKTQIHNVYINVMNLSTFCPYKKTGTF